MIRRFLACLVILGSARAACAGPIHDSIARAAWAEPAPATAISVVLCADAVLGCGYGADGSRPKWGALPWGLRPAGAGAALTIHGARIVIQRSGLKVSKAVMF
jgi:hypothetical protein